MINILKRIILENQELISSKKLVQRNYYIPETTNITVLTGIRRGGKTYTLYELAQTYKPELILFLDFEDERLVTLNTMSNYDIIIDSYKSLYPKLEPVLFFDEIQNLSNWHLFLKRLHVKGYRIFVTGSNANMISREIATFLKGRSLETTIYPFSFSEFLQLKNIEFNFKDKIINQPEIVNYFTEYIQFGGFPEIIQVAENDKRAVAKNIYNLLFYRDLVVKYDKNEYLLKLVVNKIAENITKEFSITSLANKIRVMYKASVPTITDYFNILPEPFLTTNIYPFRESFIQRETKRKTYLADNSFIFLTKVSPDNARLFENLVFNYLKRKYPEVFYYKTSNNLEVDFYIHDKEKQIRQLIQASYALESVSTYDREINSLLKAMDELKLQEGIIYTFNQTNEVIVEQKTIRIMPLWYEMLNDTEVL
ncbi:MAG TPA: ATP-binding protein [Mariniphaga anaerophila]|uniref:ATP-binding protein n=1 Tax=Mariniphaga anaerophila TaxID=1484053 RepID=A0A831PKZ0_9BACT|nr:ATP-binding protein [Mariniphaga anaerophila]